MEDEDLYPVMFCNACLGSTDPDYQVTTLLVIKKPSSDLQFSSIRCNSRNCRSNRPYG